MKTRLISVIVPVFCVEKYLDRCINSIVQQSYSNLEIILVDDGSSDNCPQKCDNWANKDRRIRVIHQKNSGLSDARNAGMRIANGAYISFIDSDDFLSEDFFESLMNTMINEDSDIVECNVKKVFENCPIEMSNDDSSISNYTRLEAISALIENKVFHQHVWNKLYKSKCICNVFFPSGKYHEDEFWTYRVFGRANKVTKLNKTMYYYFQRNDSIMGKSFNLSRLDSLEGKYCRHIFILNHYPELELQSRISLFVTCIYVYQCSLKYLKKKDKRKARKIINAYISESQLSFSEIATVNCGLRKFLFLAKINFYLCCKIRVILRIGF